MKIVKLNALSPSYMVEPLYMAFIRRLESLSNELGIAVATTGGVIMFDTERDKVKHQRNPCSGDLGPIVEEISKTKTAAATAPFDFKSFSDELREMSGRHGIKLVSVGALSGLDAGDNGTTYLAIWESGELPSNGE